MLTEEQALAELRQLNQELGLPEDDGMPMTQAQAEAELRALDEELASTPESFEEYVERRKVEDSRSLGDKTAAFTESFMTGAGALASEGSKAISELFSGDVGASEVGGVFQVGINDFGRFAKTLGGAAMDNFYSDENEMQREYQRYKDNFLYNQEVRPAMLETYDEEGRDFVSFGANFVDPTLLVPGAGLIAKGGSLGAKAVATGAKAGAFAARSPRLVQLSKAMAKTSRGADKVAKGLDKASEVASIPAKLAASGTRKAIKGSAFVGSKIAGGVGRTGEAVSKVAALPRNLATKLIPKLDPKTAGAVAATAQIGAATQGMVPGLDILTSAEILGFLANKTGRGVERTLSALSSTGGQKRFLQRLATTAESKTVRKSALMAHAGGASKLTDLAFNSLVNGASVGALNGALAYAAGEGAEGVGAAVGSGTLMGGSLPFGQPGMKGGKSQAARDQSSINFLNAKLQGDQIKEFRKLSPEARLAFATVEEAGIPRPQLAFLDKQTYLDLLREDDPNLRSAPNAHYGIADNTIYINQDGNAGRSSKEAMDILTHELGHHFIKQAIKDDPFFAEKILSEYKAKPGEESFDFAFTTDSAGAPIDSIKLNKKAVDIADLYGGIQDGIGIGRNAEKLAQEIGAEQFAMMMVDNPNIFKTIEPSLRQKLLDGSRKVLTMFGAVDPYTGNPLDVSILGTGGVKSKNPLVQRSKSIRNLYKNYVKQREYALADKIDLAENPMKIKLQRGEKPQQAVQRLFNTKGISLKEAKAFRINNLKVKEKLVEIKKRLLENPTGGMRAFVNKSGNAIAIIGKTLTPEVRSVFTGNDPFGNINTLINVAIDGIREKAQFTFLYRAGKPSKYSDNELRPRVVSPIQLRVTGLSDNSKSAASLKLDCFDEAYLRNNAEVLVQEGFAKDPKTLIEEGRRVAKESLSDPEGRINPKGEKENEIVTALFGQPESAGFIKNKKLRALLDPEQGGRLKHSFRSYDFDALAGLVPTGKDGISFDWDNVKHNHMPLDEKLFIPAYHGTPHTLAPEAGAPLGRFRTSKIGTGEGAQAYGHGLYFAGRREVAEHYRKVLSGRKDDILQEYDGKPFDRTNPKHEAARRLNKEARMLGVNKDQVRGRVQSIIENQLQRRGLNPTIEEGLRNTLEVIKNKQEAKVNEGSLYQVELAPKENEYLLYDKTLGEQPKGVQDKLKKFLREQEGEDTWQYRQEQDYRDITNNVLDDMPEAEISKRLKEAGIPGIKYLDGSSRNKATFHITPPNQTVSGKYMVKGNDYNSKGKQFDTKAQAEKYLKEQMDNLDFNYVIFDEADVTVTEKLFMPASEAGATKGKIPKSGDMLTLDDSSLKLFLPSPSNPNASLSEFKGKNVQVLTADLSVVGDKKADGAMISFTGGPGYLSVNDAWGFTNEAGAKAFKTRWERDGKPLIGITSMKQENHRASTLTREYYVRKFMEAINDGKISENTVNRHIKTALKRAIDGKNGLTNNQKAALKTVKTIEDFLKVFPDKELIPWKATPMIYGKLDAKTLPIKQDRLKKLGLDTDTILRETRQPEYNDIKKGSLLAIAEYDGSGATYRPDLNSAYPWSIPLNEKAFLKDFADIQDLSSRQDLRGSDGEANMAVAMGAGVMLDKLGRGDVNFMPSDPKAPKAQPANRIQQQAPAMPGNRFMAPAASAGAKLSERFR